MQWRHGPTRASADPHDHCNATDVRIEVLAQGSGPLVVLLPSLGRGAADFDPIAERLADAGYRVLRPQPRGIGRSRGPMTGIDLHDYAADVAAVIEHENNGPAFVVGPCVRQPGGAHARHRPSGAGARRRPGRGQYRQGAEPAGGARGDSRQRRRFAARAATPRGAAICILCARQRPARLARRLVSGGAGGPADRRRSHLARGGFCRRSGADPLPAAQPRSARPCGGRQRPTGSNSAIGSRWW